MGAGQSSNPAHNIPPQPSPAAAAANPNVNPKNPNGLKPCCVCLETKKARDTCYFEKGDEAEQKCHYLILAHKKCMEDLGFTI
ncbi:cytochrome C oxidase copper chaperone-domain-containing protein [Kickxella alabastrina]|uniref:cytochrome C oxidase copper chaperone-domain-containing protein n=1 Tax=Kickxella alabastrina TaxID=61397 RepID=UPI002220012F|nr:cytochrome C oxidase copper chaperone-domain-containing protein [Kickxella alabastrina]KAI7822243.1 cytochrome C oxidase copper chaperone-domain-containing protein [Kickxella alabastrina]KAJ1946535.1 hypothetical protein GGF37_001106 [Kickxella alabastrina]